jgi:anthranilate phosphoribosyltransferase
MPKSGFVSTNVVTLRTIWDGNGHLARRRVSCDRSAALVRRRRGHVARGSAVASLPVGTGSLRPYLERLSRRENLSKAEASAALSYVVSGAADPAEIGAFLALLAAKGESADEIAGVASAMRARMTTVPTGAAQVLDIVGTGGDGAGTVNISTAAAILAAASGCKVAKHGNRSVSSRCGSADVLEELGISLSLSPEGVRDCLETANIGFMFAPNHHPSMRFVAPVRKALRIRTVFNIMGPLLNPAGATRGVIGVYSPALLPVMADALATLGMEHAVVVHTDGLDEYSNTGVSSVIEIQNGRVLPLAKFDAQVECGIPRCTIADLKGGDAADNAAIIRRVLSGELVGPITDAIALNAGVGCYVYGLDKTVADGVERVKGVLMRGEGLRTLSIWAESSQAAVEV